MSDSIFQALVDRDVTRLRSTIPSASRPLADSVTMLTNLSDQRSVATSHKKYVDEAVKTFVTTHGTHAWSEVDPEVRRLLEERGFSGNRVNLATDRGPVGVRLDPVIDPVRAFAIYGTRAGRWKLEEAANTIRYMHDRGVLSTLDPGVLEVDRVEPIASYALMPPSRPRGPSGAPIDLTGAPPEVKAPISADNVAAYLDYREHLGRRIKTVEAGMEPHKDVVRHHLLVSGTINDTVIDAPDTDGWRLIAKPSILVDPMRLVPVMNADIARSVGTDREQEARRVWENLSYQIDADWVKDQARWHSTAYGPDQASQVLQVARPKKASKAA